MIFYVQSDPLDLRLDLLRCNDENSRVNCVNVLSIYMLINTTYIIIAVISLVVISRLARSATVNMIGNILSSFHDRPYSYFVVS